MMPRKIQSLLWLFLAVVAAAEETAPKFHHTQSHDTSHETIQQELESEGFTCTISGASGQDQCDAAQDDDGSKCVWCVLNSFGFCINEMQAEQFKQIMPTIDCDDDGSTDDDATPPAEDDDSAGPLWQCLESQDEDSCSDTCVWCDTKGGFGVCVTPEAAQMAENSYWFDCKTDADYEEEEEEEEDNQWHEFIVDTNCVVAGMTLQDSTNSELFYESSEDACFHAKDSLGNPCEWCSVAGSPLQLCLSEPQAQVAEYVGAICSGSDETFDPEDFDDSCVGLMHINANLDRHGCWQNQDLDGNVCEWCTLQGVELCLGGVQAELVEHWGATCVLDETEHGMAQKAIEQHQEFLKEIKERKSASTDNNNKEEEEEELDLSTIWLTSDPSCMVTTLTSATDPQDKELACAEASDKNGNPCNWCSIGTMLDVCVNDEQADIAEAMGMECETISSEARQVLREHAERVAAEEEEEEEEEEEDYEITDFDPSCIMSMQAGPDKDSCVATKDQDGQACQWCSWNDYHACLASEQAEMVEPFGVDCDGAMKADEIAASTKEALEEMAPDVDTSCLIGYTDEASCVAGKDDSQGKPCEWCTLGSLGVQACMSEEQADMAKPLGVTCSTDAKTSHDEEEDEDEELPVLKALPDDFWSCLSQSQSLDDCDESCTWCDLKGGNGVVSGLCLSGPVADAVVQLSGDQFLVCDDPDYDEEEDYDDDYGEEDYEEVEEEEDSEEEEEEKEKVRRSNLGDLIAEAMEGSIA